MMNRSLAVAALALALMGAAPQGTSREPLKPTFQVRGYFYAGGRTEGLGGFASSDNLPQDPPAQWRSERLLSLIVDPSDRQAFGEYDGFRVWLINGTSAEVAIDAQDSRLPIVREALNADGQWQPIEYLPHSWCGNSYHQVFLPSGKAWAFVAPRYEGPMSTRMRFRLDAPGGPVYSGEFRGRIDPAQFTGQQGHTPTNIMDPYNE